MGTVISRGLGLLASILVARLLGKVGFGELGIIQSTVGMVGTFAGFGLGMTATKFIAESRLSDPARAGRMRAITSAVAWITGSFAGLILLLIAPLLARHTLAAPHLTGLLRISALYLLLTAATSAQVGSLAGCEAFGAMARISIWAGLANFPLMVCGAYLAGLTGVVWAMVIATGINWLLNHFAVRREFRRRGIPLTYQQCWTETGVLWKFSLPVMVSGLFAVPTEWALNAMLVNQPGGYAQMGLFNAARQWHTLILFLPGIISSTTIPILVSLLGENKQRQYGKLLVYNSILLTGMALVLALPVALLARSVMSVYGDDFAEGAMVLIYVCIAAVLFASNIVVGQALWCMGATRAAMIFSAMRSGLLLVSFSLFQSHGARGLALSFLVTYVVQTIYLVPYVWHKGKAAFAALADSAAKQTAIS